MNTLKLHVHDRKASTTIGVNSCQNFMVEN